MDRLLFVDDEPFVLRALKRTFELEGFEVVTANRPADALDLLRNGPGFVVIASDYRMPEMNGAEFLQQARELATASADVRVNRIADFDVIEKRFRERVQKQRIADAQVEAGFERRRAPLVATDASRALRRSLLRLSANTCSLTCSRACSSVNVCVGVIVSSLRI